MQVVNKKNLISLNKKTNKLNFEKRKFSRLKVTDFNIIIEIKPFNEKNFIKANTINIGNGGIMVHSKKNIPVGDKISFKLKLPSPFNLIKGIGKIKWGVEKNNKLYHGMELNEFKDEIYTAEFYDFLNENSIKKNINDLLKEKDEKQKVNILSNRIPKNKNKSNHERRKDDRRKQQIIINFMDRRIKEQRKKNRRQEEDRRKNKSSTRKEKRKIERRKISFLDYSKEFIEHRRNWLSKKLNVNLNHIGNFSMDTQKAKGNIENMIGATQIPIGIAGPCKINGEYAKGDFYIPLATTEGSLVLTYQRGMTAINLAGGANVKILKNKIHISPVFILKNLAQCIKFEKWINDHFNEIKKEAEKTTRYGKLLSIESRITGDKVFLIFYYTTGDAAGQNMLIKSAEAACNYISAKTGYHYYLKSNLSANKKASWFNYINGYGKSVIAEVTISNDIMQRVFNINAKDIYDLYQAYVTAGSLTGIVGLNSHFANGIGALYLACGQDIAHIATAHSGLAYWECMKDNNLYVSVNLPSLMIGTVGGGTGLSTQKECLKIIDCFGTGKANKFAEIIAVTALSGEISLGTSLAYGTFGYGHLKYGRK